MPKTIRAVFLFVAMAASACLSWQPCHGNEPGSLAATDGRPPPKAGHAPCGRIVSLAPSITESLFALGVGDQVVGVTRYCNYPPEARAKEKVGGYQDLNYEAVLALKPDLVVLLPEHDKASQDLENLGLNLLSVDHRSIEGILDSFDVLTGACRLQAACRASLPGP